MNLPSEIPFARAYGVSVLTYVRQKLKLTAAKADGIQGGGCLIVPTEVKKNIPGKRRRYESIYENNRELFRIRKVTIEPFFDRLDQCFDIGLA